MDKDILIWPAEVHFIRIKSPEVELFILMSRYLKSRLCVCVCVIKMKLPSSVGQKKIKAIEQILIEQGVGEDD